KSVHLPDGAEPRPQSPAAACPRHLPAAEPAHHRRAVRRLLRHHRRLAGALRGRLRRHLRGRDPGRRRRPGGAPDQYPERVRRAVRLAGRPGQLRHGAGAGDVPLGAGGDEARRCHRRQDRLAGRLPYAACAALRLARFNSQVGQVDKRWFIGLASPAAAGLMASFAWTCHEFGWSGEELRYGALAVTVVAGLLMVSRIRYTSFKGSGSGPKSDRVPFFALLIAVAVLTALWNEPPVTLLVAGTLYALSGPLQWLRRRMLPAQDGAG